MKKIICKPRSIVRKNIVCVCVCVTWLVFSDIFCTHTSTLHSIMSMQRLMHSSKQAASLDKLFPITFSPLLSLFFPLYPLLSSLVSYPSNVLLVPLPFFLPILHPLFIFTTPVLLSLPGTASVQTPPLLTKPFLHPSSLSIRAPFHLDLYVSVGLSILLHGGSKLKYCSGLHWSLIEFKKRKCHKENLWWKVCNILKGSPGYDSDDRERGLGRRECVEGREVQKARKEGRTK